MYPSFRFDLLNLGWSIVYIEGSQVIHVPAESNSLDPDIKPDILCPNCLQRLSADRLQKVSLVGKVCGAVSLILV